MKMSRRARRMDRNHKRNKSVGALNLVSLMDIFTILVFFLLVNSSSVQEMPNSKLVKLPQSTSDRPPADTLLLLVNREHILLQGEPIVKISDIENQETLLISPLLDALRLRAKQKDLENVTAEGEAIPGEVTILGDKEIPYRLLKRIMTTCTEANFSSISLAVTRKPKEKV